ncbi:MAG: uracil-DNA glycosylase [Aquificaceae bacterium]|nr:MAG: uracil-DNA glycosylase [Aquificaceae bacterium]
MAVTQQQLSYLKAMGIPVWVSRDAVDASLFELDTKVVTNQASEFKIPSPSSVNNKQTSPTTISHVAKASSSLSHKGDELPAKTPPKPLVDVVAEKPSVKIYTDCTSLDWQQLQSAVIACKQCDLHGVRTQTVFGEGIVNAKWMIIGDAPKEEDDLQGRAFTDRSGILLDNMLMAVGLDRTAVYLTNTLKCRPSNNRDPRKEEFSACVAYLKRQIDLVKPSLILIVGRIATQHLLETKEPLARLRGRPHKIFGLNTPVVVTYHPAYLLRQPRDKYKSWEDLKLAQSLMNKMGQSF